MEYVIQELPERIPLGNQGEKSATIIQFNVGAWQMDYPTGAVLVAANPGIDDGLYISYTRSDYPHNVYVESPSALTLNGKILEWTPSEAVLQVAGVGTIVLHCVDDGVEKRSLMRFSYVTPGHGVSETAPPPLYDYIVKWGSVDATTYLVNNSLDPEVTVIQDASGTHFTFGIPLNALMRDIENTNQVPTLNGDGTIAQILHNDLDTSATLRTDSFVYDGFLITQTRTLADGSYLVITTNTDTMEQTISNIVEGA